MPTKETFVEYLDQPGHQFPVVFTDEFTETNLGLFSYDSVNNRFEDYLFVAYFSDKVDSCKWYFGKARRHDEFILGVREKTKHDEEKFAGQFAVRKRKGKMVFTELLLHSLPSSNDEVNKNIFRNLMQQIHPDFLDNEVPLFSSSDPDMDKWGYYYSKKNQLLENVREYEKRHKKEKIN